MTDTRVTVVSVSRRHVVVDIPDERGFACGTCTMAEKCVQAPRGRVKRYRFLRPENLSLAPGNVVILRTRDVSFWIGLAYVYGVPAVLAIIGIVLTSAVMQGSPYHELIMGIGALAGVAAGFLLAAWRNGAYQPEIIPLPAAGVETTVTFYPRS